MIHARFFRPLLRKLGSYRVALLAAAAVLLAGCASREADPRPVVALLFTLDTFRADHLGCAGNPIVRTPHLDRLARSGSLWRDAFSPIPLTTPSHATIFSGVSPRIHGVLKNRTRLADTVPTFPEQIRATGARTGAVVSAPIVLGPDLGLTRGFDAYVMTNEGGRPARTDGFQTMTLARDWLSEDPGVPAFLWVHLFDAHLPYDPPPPVDALYDADYDGGFSRGTSREQIQAAFERGEGVSPRDVIHLRALYASAVTFVDWCVGSLVRHALLELPPADLRVLVTADHGEGLHEHDRYFGHDTLLYDTALRVPLILAGGDVPRGVRTDFARTIDVAPTLLSWFGVDPGPELEGRDLLREEAAPGPFFVETHPAAQKAPPEYGARSATHKVLFRPDSSLWESYDLTVDPAETNDLGERRDDPFAGLARALARDLERHKPTGSRTIDDERGGPSDDVVDALEALGYLD